MQGTPGTLENSGDSVPLAAHIQYYCFAVSDFLVKKKPVSSLNRFAQLFAVLLQHLSRDADEKALNFRSKRKMHTASACCQHSLDSLQLERAMNRNIAFHLAGAFRYVGGAKGE
jgi:hypothetical protein